MDDPKNFEIYQSSSPRPSIWYQFEDSRPILSDFSMEAFTNCISAFFWLFVMDSPKFHKFSIVHVVMIILWKFELDWMKNDRLMAVSVFSSCDLNSRTEQTSFSLKLSGQSDWKEQTYGSLNTRSLWKYTRVHLWTLQWISMNLDELFVYP